MTDKKQVAVIEQQAVTPMGMIEIALNQNADIDKLSQLMDMQERYEANEAKKSYVVAMTAFKAASTIISKDKTVSFGGTSYKHASLANIVRTVTEALAKHDLSHNWVTDQSSGGIKVTCVITHILGHSESTTMESTPDQSGEKNNIQAIGSAVTYLQRYTLLALTGLATDDQDDDGIKAEDRLSITDAQITIIEKLIAASGGNDETFLNFYNINGVDQLQQRDYNEAVKILEIKIKKAGK